jgi:hypothetical protein
MAYVDFPDNLKGQRERKAFWLSDNGLKLIGGWKRQGISTTKIVEDYIGVGKTAFFSHWLKESDELRKVLNNSKDLVDMTVEEALLKRATGYDYWEEVWELVEGDVIMTKKYKKHMPPDVKAILTYLYNKLPGRWRAVQEPLEQTQYVETVQNILVAMKEVAENGNSKQIETTEEIVEQ